MHTRHFHSIPAPISLLGFGGMRLPILDNDLSKIDIPAAEAMIDLAVRGGVNYFDTAWIYHDGASETFFGNALSKYPRESFHLADKLPTWEIGSEKDVHRIFRKQLQKCRVDTFDFYLVHCLNKSLAKTLYDVGIYDLLRKKKDAGEIRRLGFSFHDHPDLMEKLVADFDWDFIQIQLNYLDWTDLDARRLYDIITAKRIPIIVMEPVRGGALATLNPSAAAILKAADPSASLASWAIRYAASFPNVLTVLSGMSTLDQVADNVRTLTDFRPLTPDESATLQHAITAYRSTSAIPCTSCSYCLPCPAGVAIPRVFSIYNYALTSHDFPTVFADSYRSLSASQHAHHCTSCGRCLSLCPQKIDIPTHLHKIVKETP